MAGLDRTWQGMAGLDRTWQGMAGHDMASQGMLGVAHMAGSYHSYESSLQDEGFQKLETKSET